MTFFIFHLFTYIQPNNSR